MLSFMTPDFKRQRLALSDKLTDIYDRDTFVSQCSTYGAFFNTLKCFNNILETSHISHLQWHVIFKWHFNSSWLCAIRMYVCIFCLPQKEVCSVKASMVASELWWLGDRNIRMSPTHLILFFLNSNEFSKLSELWQASTYLKWQHSYLGVLPKACSW